MKLLIGWLIFLVNKLNKLIGEWSIYKIYDWLMISRLKAHALDAFVVFDTNCKQIYCPLDISKAKSISLQRILQKQRDGTWLTSLQSWSQLVNILMS